MALSIGRITVGDAASRAAIVDGVRTVGTDAGGDWTVSLVPGAEPASWDLQVDGPRRRRGAEAQWQTPLGGPGVVRYRRLLLGREQSPAFVRTVLRRLVWENLDFRDDTLHGAAEAEGYEEALWSVLRAYQVPPLSVRLSCWRGDPACLQYVCKVEVDPRFAGGAPQWRWWSALVNNPDALAEALDGALMARFPAAGSARSGRPAAARPHAAVVHL